MSVLKPEDDILPHRMEAIVRYSNVGYRMSVVGHQRTWSWISAASAIPPKSRPKWRTGAVVDSDLTAAI